MRNLQKHLTWQWKFIGEKLKSTRSSERTSLGSQWLHQLKNSVPATPTFLLHRRNVLKAREFFCSKTLKVCESNGVYQLSRKIQKTPNNPAWNHAKVTLINNQTSCYQSLQTIPAQRYCPTKTYHSFRNCASFRSQARFPQGLGAKLSKRLPKTLNGAPLSSQSRKRCSFSRSSGFIACCSRLYMNWLRCPPPGTSRTTQFRLISQSGTIVWDGWLDIAVITHNSVHDSGEWQPRHQNETLASVNFLIFCKSLVAVLLEPNRRLILQQGRLEKFRRSRKVDTLSLRAVQVLYWMTLLLLGCARHSFSRFTSCLSRTLKSLLIEDFHEQAYSQNLPESA